MILHHIAHHTGLVVVAAALFHRNLLGNGDAHIVDIVAIPQWLENRVRKAEDQQVLHHVLAQIVVDAIDLALVEYLPDQIVQLDSGAQIIAEWFFDDDPAPARRLVRETLRLDISDRSLEQPRRDG